MDRIRRDERRREERLREALVSPKWDAGLVARHNFAWLGKNGHHDEDRTQGEVVGDILHRMVLDGEFAAGMAKVLDAWRAWADNAGMRKGDFDELRENQVMFARASLLVAAIKDASTAAEGTLAMDLQECLRLWQKVRLG